MKELIFSYVTWLRYFLAVTVISLSVKSQGSTPLKDEVNEELRVSVFDVDATPPAGTFLAYDSAINSWDLGLRAKGIVLLGADKPIVLCSIDWIGIGNEGHDAFCEEIARAAGTTPDRVAVHTVHQHDAPACDFGAEKILRKAGVDPAKYDGTFQRIVLKRLGKAVEQSLRNSAPLTQIGYGESKVSMVASNRRIFDEHGKILPPRLSACWSPALRAKPEGLIDPYVRLISFWNADKPIAVLSYYAVHPQSYYRTGIPNPDFPGIARFMRQLAVPQALHIHFNGAGGNVTAGKYNDGSLENRGILAKRLEEGMKHAWETSAKFKISSKDIHWGVEPIALPPAQDLNLLEDPNFPSDSLLVRTNAARMAWLKRCRAGNKIDIGCLYLGKIRILHLPGEPFIEYQLAAIAERKDLFVAVAGYGDYGPGYIGTAVAYQEGGYETSYVSKVSAGSEEVLMGAMKKLLHKNR